METLRLFSRAALVGLVIVLLLIRPSAAQPSSALRPANVSTAAWQMLESTGETEVLVILADRADLGPAAEQPTRPARLSAVRNALLETARRSQADLRVALEAADVAYRPFYVTNAILVRGDRSLVTRLAARPEVARIAANPRIRQALPEPQLNQIRPHAIDSVEWGVARVNADDVWAQEYTGQGIVVAGQDTGYDWDHPALVEQYRGTDGATVSHDYNWHDAIHSGGGVCGADSPEPCDDGSHGTHTMGTIVGEDGANQIGVAPGAQWIGCRNMDRGFGTPASYMECFEFFLAPYPVGGDPFTEGDPTKAPHVINNSWTCPPSEGCDWQTLQSTVENMRAAGILVVASAGNSGSACSSVDDPPAIYEAAFSVGATDFGDGIASFSSRGPVTIDGSGRPKPDIAAPGVGVRSCVPGTTYSWKSGTSMAGPHVAGVAALVWSAAPGLIGDLETTEAILKESARPRTTAQACGEDNPGDVPNNVYGWGIVDALGALERVGLLPDKQVTLPDWELPVRHLNYTLWVTNTSPATLTHVVLTDTLPAGLTLTWASAPYTYADPVITWEVESLAAHEALTAAWTASVAAVPRGTRVVNADYAATAAELSRPVPGAPMETVIPWRVLLVPVYKDWSPGGSDSE